MTARAALTILIAMLIAFGAGIATGKAIEGWRLGVELERERAGHADLQRRQAESQATALAGQRAERVEQEGRLHAIDTTYTEELNRVRKENARLVAELRAARGMSDRTPAAAACPGGVPAVTAATGVDDAAGEADIHRARTEGVVVITGEADECAVRLTALQRWVSEVVSKQR